MAGNASLMVNTEQLITCGGELIGLKSTLDSCLDSLNKTMGGITDAWKDDDGQAFKTKFETFINDAKKIDMEIGALGVYATSVASKYDAILAESIRMMGD